MFKSKKKTDLPARPDPPTWDEMEEDLKATTNADVIFTLSSITSGTKEVQDPEKNREDLSQEELFRQAKEFVVMNDEIIENMALLQEKKEKLREVTENLKKTVESVKKQALVAIDAYENRG
ncbi:UPF0449 protein C19orf25 homolog [Macrobrachium nipponense]|uniref:UPF0449 protein C19orf25 homolog n=1 Tax=Macrobrachium nipponense TaxID=159736 RepID=UPI0030C7FA77